MKRRLVLLALLPLLIAAGSARAANPDAQNYRRAFALIDSGRALEAEVFAVRGRDPILNKVIRGIAMAQPGNAYGFEELAAFIAANPGWPDLRGITAIAEQKIPATLPAAQIVAWFDAHPPVTLAGFYAYIDALNVSGQTQNVANLIHARWGDGDFSAGELAAFSARFPQFLGADDMRRRVERLLWKNDAAGVRLLYPSLDAGLKALAAARLALAARSPSAGDLAGSVPNELQDDPGLLYERLRWYVHNNQDDAALGILRGAPATSENPDAWWEQRQIMARRLMDHKDYEGAYALAAGHGALKGRQFIEAEFLCGWLALRFLDDEEEARQHFQALYDHAGTPISRARGAYWLGRTYEAHGDRDQAEQFYETAAALNITYYGQLAATRIYARPVMTATPEPAIPNAVRNAFYDRDLIRAVERLAAVGEIDRAHGFFHAAVAASQQRADFALLTELAYRIERPDFAIEAGKAATSKNMLMASGGFPLLAQRLPRLPDPAFTHALIRQESMFNPDARSPAGAEGLMQLMPSTAKDVARQIGVRFRKRDLSQPAYNLRLGAAFVQDQIDSFDGSYVLALAGYNAGPRRVREWMAHSGDPRRADIDVVDWIEEIPIGETRNYVQRIIESLQVYRARLAGGRAPLEIVRDLKR
jgi:soluble lytic murein transglycosylase